MKIITLALCLLCIQGNSQAITKSKNSNKTILKSNRDTTIRSGQITYTILVNIKTKKRDTLIAYKDLLFIDDNKKP